MGLFDFLLGKPAQSKTKQYPSLAPFQMSALQNYFANPIQGSPLFGSGSSFLQNLLMGGDEAFKNFEAPFMQNFQENIIPGIAERFAGMGAGSSSALNNSLAQAGRGLQTDLAGLRSGLQMQALPQALLYAQQPYSNITAGMQSPYQYNQNSTGAQGGLLSAMSQFRNLF